MSIIIRRDIADPTSYNRWVRGISVLRQKWNAAGRNALGTPIKAYGESVQRDLPPANAKHNAARLPPHLLQQHGKSGNEPKDTAIPYGS